MVSDGLKTRLSNSLTSSYAKLAMLLLLLLLLWQLLLAVLFPNVAIDLQLQTQLPLTTMGQWQWFANDKSPTPASTLKKAQTPADLVGLIYTPTKQIAIISTARLKDKPYVVGNSIAPGVRIKNIQPQSVILNEQGVERLLELKQQVIDNIKVIDQNKKTPFRSSSNTTSSPSPINLSPTNLAKLSGVADILAVKTDDGAIGFKLGNLNIDVANSSGLQADDIIVKVDQRAITSVIQDSASINRLVDSHHVTLEVLRNGSPQTITIDAKQLATQLLSP